MPIVAAAAAAAAALCLPAGCLPTCAAYLSVAPCRRAGLRHACCAGLPSVVWAARRRCRPRCAGCAKKCCTAIRCLPFPPAMLQCARGGGAAARAQQASCPWEQHTGLCHVLLLRTARQPAFEPASVLPAAASPVQPALFSGCCNLSRLVGCQCAGRWQAQFCTPAADWCRPNAQPIATGSARMGSGGATTASGGATATAAASETASGTAAGGPGPLAVAAGAGHGRSDAA